MNGDFPKFNKALLELAAVCRQLECACRRAESALTELEALGPNATKEQLDALVRKYERKPQPKSVTVFIANGPPAMAGRVMRFEGMESLPESIKYQQVKMPHPCEFNPNEYHPHVARLLTAWFKIGLEPDNTIRRKDGMPVYFFDRWEK